MNFARFYFAFLICCARCLHGEDFVPPEGEHAATQFGVGLPPEANAIQAKITAAVAAKKEWLQEYLASLNLKPGELLPYHPNLGVTNEEYETFLAALPKIGMIKIGDAKVKVSFGPAGRVIELSGTSLPVTKFEELAQSGQWRCELGTTTEKTTIDQTDEKSPTGAWKGEQWTFSEGTPDLRTTNDVKHMRFGLGVDSKGRKLVYLRVITRIKNVVTDFSGVIRWPNA